MQVPRLRIGKIYWVRHLKRCLKEPGLHLKLLVILTHSRTWGPSNWWIHKMKLDHSGLSIQDTAKRGITRDQRRMGQCGINKVEREALKAPLVIRVAKATFPCWTSQERMLERERERKKKPKMFGIRVTVQERHTHILFTSRRRTVDISRGSYFSNVCRLDWVEKEYKLI